MICLESLRVQNETAARAAQQIFISHQHHRSDKAGFVSSI